MKVRTIQGGTAAFNALVYQQPDERLLGYFNDSLNYARDRMGDIGNGFMTMANDMYNKYNSQEVINAGKAILYGVGTHMSQDVIYPVSQNQLHSANLVMQQYIMSQPEVNAMYNKNMCYGYQDTFIDIEPNNTGTERIMYRDVMDGVVQFDEDDAYRMRYFHSDIEGYNKPLDVMDRFAILDTWDAVSRAILEDIDPTDPTDVEY